MAKTAYMAFLMEPEEKEILEQKAFDSKLRQGEIIRRALAFYFANVLSNTNRGGQGVDSDTVARSTEPVSAH